MPHMQKRPLLSRAPVRAITTKMWIIVTPPTVTGSLPAICVQDGWYAAVRMVPAHYVPAQVVPE
jgi:hypothetical protein